MSTPETIAYETAKSELDDLRLYCKKEIAAKLKEVERLRAAKVRAERRSTKSVESAAVKLRRGDAIWSPNPADHALGARPIYEMPADQRAAWVLHMKEVGWDDARIEQALTDPSAPAPVMPIAPPEPSAEYLAQRPAAVGEAMWIARWHRLAARGERPS